jgi:hypothetical protein
MHVRRILSSGRITVNSDRNSKIGVMYGLSTIRAGTRMKPKEGLYPRQPSLGKGRLDLE